MNETDLSGQETLLSFISVFEIVALVVVLAIYLLLVASLLRSISSKLAEIAWGARAVERQLRASRSNIRQVNAALTDIAQVAPGVVRMADDFAFSRGRS